MFLNILFYELQNAKDIIIKNNINYIFVRLLKAKKRKKNGIMYGRNLIYRKF